MTDLYADRIAGTPKSFIREILKVTEQPEVISFAGGLPSPELFPAKEISDAAQKVLSADGKEALQYSTTEGYLPLREFIANRYTAKGFKTDPDQIIITSGSQQGLDLVGKLFLNRKDTVIIESPGYLGAIQAFSLYEPLFSPTPMLQNGIALEPFVRKMNVNHTKLAYLIPNFQNPTGITYDLEKRQRVADALNDSDLLLVEDDPYGDLRFSGGHLPTITSMVGGATVLLGSFSKTVAPGLRIGWMRAGKDIIEKAIVVKQATDLHTNYLSQRTLSRYLADNDLDDHIKLIREKYSARCDLMVDCIKKHFPENVSFTKPEGGMFLWVTLPENVSSMEVFDAAIKKDVAFVPGAPFFVDGGGENALRLNFSNPNEENIEEGIKRLGEVIKEVVGV